MRYPYLIIGLLFIGCSSKNVTIESPKVSKVETKQVVKPKPIAVEEKIYVEEKVVVEEPKITKNIKRDVPPSCAMWSDGCNVCTRINVKKASCTTYPDCHNRVVSCLQWQ